MIVATAGHIDHGKTSLVKALTGIDTDRLPEEKRRGMTIDLGFAYRRTDDDHVLGFVDVPGHDRFIHTMVAGVGAVDFALLVTAADDGPMPQTAEHLAILSLLGIERGAIVVTKIDRTGRDRLQDVANRVRALARGGVWAAAPDFPVSSLTGEGMPALLDHLAAQAKQVRSRRATRAFRMAVDRVFTIEGAGLVASGMIVAGEISLGDQVVVSPDGLAARVRRLHANNHDADKAAAGERCALNLVFQKNSAVRRGDWIVDPELNEPTQRFDAKVTILERAPRPLRSGSSLHVHIGTADIVARVDVLGRSTLRPGESGMVQIVTDKAIHALRADRFILRDRSATLTMGGGTVVDPWSSVRGRARAPRLAILEAMARPSPDAAFPELVSISEDGVDWIAFKRAWNLPDGVANDIVRDAAIVELKHAGAPILLARNKWDLLTRDIINFLRRWHEIRPDEIGPSRHDLAVGLKSKAKSPVLDSAIEKLLQGGNIERTKARLRLPGHEPVLRPADRSLWDRVRALYSDSESKPPSIYELTQRLDIEKEELEGFLTRMAQRGYLARVSENRFFMTDHLQELALLAKAMTDEAPDGAFIAAAYRDRCRLGRNLTIELLEYFDRVGLTHCVAGKRYMRRQPVRTLEACGTHDGD